MVGLNGRTPWCASMVLLVSSLLFVGCGPAPARAPTTSGQEATQGPKGTLRIAWGPEPPGLDPKLFRIGPQDTSEFSAIFSSVLTFTDPTGSLRPLLARTAPTLENRDLIVNPDGTMVTVYRLRENAKWHDGERLTAHDFVFGNGVYSDPEIPATNRSTQALIANVQATDDYTLRIVWKQPYFLAGALGSRDLLPLPRHLLEEKAQSSKANFASGPDWSTNFVGSGPFLVERWDLGSGVIARAFPDWFLGPPKLARLDIRFIGDANTVLANLLSGEADFTMTDFISPTLVVSSRERWVGGGIGYINGAEATAQYAVFQFREVPDWQRIVTDLRVRRALVHSIDRQALADVVTAGFGSPADLFLFSSHPVYPEADRASAKYPYDPRRATSLLAEAGWSTQEGALLKNAEGQSLKVSYWRSAAPQAEQEVSLVVDNWKAVGVDAESFLIPAARASDAEFVVSFPGVLASSRPLDPGSFAFTSDRKPTAANRWTGINRGSFEDPEIDDLHHAVLTLVEPADWRRALVGLHKRMSELVGAYPLYNRPRVIMGRNELRGPMLNPVNGGSAVMWNVYEWEVAQ